MNVCRERPIVTSIVSVLLIDIGNTRIKWRKLRFDGRAAGAATRGGAFRLWGGEDYARRVFGAGAC